MDVEVVGVCDQARERAEQARRKFGLRHAFASLDEMLQADVDVVHVLLPPDRHVDAARRVLESGRHVFVEKPMGLAAAECRALVDLAGKRGCKLGVNHNLLFLPAFERLRRDAADGTLGALDQLTISWMYPLELIQRGPFDHWMLREPCNLFFEVGPHLAALMLDLVGPLERMHTVASLPLALPGGATVYRHWHAHGVKGRAAIDLVLSVVAGPSDRSITVRGHGALAKCYFDRDLYYREEPVGFGVIDNFASAAGVAWQLGANAGRNLVKSLGATLTKTPAADPFLESVALSVDRFYDTLDGGLDPRLDGRFGVQVIEQCERIVANAAFENQAPLPSVRPAAAATKPPTVLVIGGTGFIGRHLVRALAARDVGVRVATRALGAARIALAGLPVELVQGDLADTGFVDAALEGIDVVYHLARGAGERWEDYQRQDVLVTKLVAERALAKGVKRFVYTGTIDSYYAADPNQVITADTPLDPKIHRRNPYARSKAACEALLAELHRKQALPLVILRPGIVIGQGCPPAHWGVGRYLSATRLQLWGNGRNALPFVLVEDVAAALLIVLDKPGIEGQAFLLTDEPLLNARDYIEAVSTACGTRLRARPTPIWKFYLGDLVKEAVKHLVRHPNRRIPSYRDWNCRSQLARYDSSKTRAALGWQPAGTREALIGRGIVAAVDESLR